MKYTTTVRASLLAIAITTASLAAFAEGVSATSDGDPRPPAEWKMPAKARYIGLNSMGKPCWKWWRIVQCVK